MLLANDKTFFHLLEIFTPLTKNIYWAIGLMLFNELKSRVHLYSKRPSVSWRSLMQSQMKDNPKIPSNILLSNVILEKEE